MKALILDSALASDPLAIQINHTLVQQLQARGWEVEHILLREQKIGNCAGDFFCWIKTPGTCMTNDDNRRIAAGMIQCDLLIYLTPITFGGYSSILKRMIDHQIQNLSPYFTLIQSETHHQRRYERYPAMLSIGWLDTPDPTSEAIFRHLVQRNALNMYAPTIVCGILYAHQPEDEIVAQASSWLNAIESKLSSPVPELPEERIAPPAPSPAQRAVILVGSPRTNQSTSYAIAEYLREQLAKQGVATQHFQIYTTIHSSQHRDKLLAAIDTADLTVLAFPLYIDSLPGHVIAALEIIAAHRRGTPSDQRFAAIANCGFPEAQHNINALAICEIFARQAGFDWAGSLALGQGEGMIHGQPLHTGGIHIAPIRRALEMAAVGLSTNGVIPMAAAELMAQPIIPAWLYTFVGGFSWARLARHHKAEHQLRQQPYRKTHT